MELCRSHNKVIKTMKKILIASLLALSSLSAFAAPDQSGLDPAFAKVQQYLQAKNYTAAYTELDVMAKAGNAQAMYNQAYMIQMGQGTTKNNAKALKLYQDSSDKGYSVASYVLAQSYATGELGLTKDAKKSKTYLEKASSQGFDDATLELAVMAFAEGKDKEALQKIDPLIKKGNSQAIHTKALYDITQGYKTKNETLVKQGLNSIRDLATKGYVPALMAVANMMTNGNIIEQNLPEAKKIYTALAKDNIPKAKESLDVVNKLLAEQAKQPAPKK